MNNNLKKIIAFTIICTALSTWMPSTMNLGNQYAYAYSDDELTGLSITSGVSIIPIYSSRSHKYEYRVKSGANIPITVFSKISSDQTNIKLSELKTKSSDIRVFVGKDNIKLNDIYSEIKIEKGEKKSIYIRLYDSKVASDKDFSTEYELLVEREDNVDDNTVFEDEVLTTKEYGDAYLNDLILSNNDKTIDFNFNKAQSVYNINVDENIDYIKIKAVPEQDSYKLRINDDEIDTKGSNKNIKSLLLNEGKNFVKIRIISTEHEVREYFLNVTRGISTATEATTSKNTTVTTTDDMTSQKIQSNSNWQYKKADGTLAIGWTCIGNDWYYFDSTGTMKTGWLQTAPGKWYYLKETGAMVKDTTINGYKIGSDGVYITK